MNGDTLDRLLDGYFEGTLTASETADLSLRLRESASARAAYWEAAQMHAALSLWGEQQAGLVDMGTGQSRPPAARPKRRTWIAGLAAAAAIALVAAGWWRSNAAGRAWVTFASGARWTDEGPDRRGRLGEGEHGLGEGVVRFETAAGAVVSVAAPARFRIAAADRIELRSGRLTARLLTEEARLAVRCGEIEITDLGTSFGVDADGAGVTLVSVFDGEVAVSGGGAAGLRLTEGQSALGGAAGGRAPQATRYDPHPFRELWPLTVGVNEASSLIEFLPPGPLLRPLREYRADGRLFLLPERQKAVTDRRLALDLAPSAPMWPDSPVSPYPLEAEARVSSYLLFFQPEVGGAGLRHLKGSITFHGRVLGVICSDQGLSQSDAAVGLAGADYSTPGQRRGLEEADKENYRGATLPHDSIRLSDDGRTVEFDFHVSDEREQMRILVDADARAYSP
jgi:hypothetical protein